MIIIIEGCRGTGKTSVCQVLSEVFKAPIIRPFRPDVYHHHSGESGVEMSLKAMGVPVNTHVDDLYVADILANITAIRPELHFVLDRSMASAVAHRTCPSDGAAVLSLWQSLLARAPDVRYVWLRAPYAVAAKRVAATRRLESRAEYERLERAFASVYASFRGPKLSLATTHLDAVAVSWCVARWADNSVMAMEV